MVSRFEKAKKFATSSGFSGIDDKSIKWNGYDVFFPYMRDYFYIGFHAIVLNDMEIRFATVEEKNRILMILIRERETTGNDKFIKLRKKTLE